MKTQYDKVYQFGPYRLEVDVRRLSRDGQSVQLTSRLLDILLLLIMHRGEIVTKDDLLREIWANQIVEENNVAVAVSALRRVLGETHGNHEYIQTMQRRGYRFVGRVREVVGSFDVVGNQSASTRRYTENADAYYLYLKGRHLARQRSIEDIRRSIQCFEKAIQMDESYALAYAGIADCHHLLVLWNALAPKAAYPLARRAAMKALQIDKTLSEARSSLAFVEFHDWHFAIAEREFKWALELDPNNVTALRWYSAFLSALGNFEEAFKTCTNALKMDPLSPQGRTQLARYYYYANQYERALQECGEVLELNRDWPDAHAVTGLIKLKKGMYDEALEAFRMTSRLLPDDPEPRMLLACGYAASGRHKDAQNVLSSLRTVSLRSYVPPHLFAWIYSQMRDADNALYWLEKMYEHHSYALAYLKIDPLFDPIRSDKRFSNLLWRIGLEQ